MKKIAFVLFLIVSGIIYTYFKFWLTKNYFCNDYHAHYYEESAKKHHTFVAKFRIVEAEKSVKDSLSKYDYLPILDTLTFLVERVYRNCPKYLFLFEKKIQEKKLIYFSPFMGNCENIRKYHDKIGHHRQPDLFFQIDQDSIYIGAYFERSIVINQQNLEHIDIENTTQLKLNVYLGVATYTPYKVVQTHIGIVTLSCIESRELGQSSTTEFHFIAPTIPPRTMKCY